MKVIKISVGKVPLKVKECDLSIFSKGSRVLVDLYVWAQSDECFFLEEVITHVPRYEVECLLEDGTMVTFKVDTASPTSFMYKYETPQDPIAWFTIQGNCK